MRESRELLQSVFGFDTFRPGQEEIVAAILAGRDLLAIMPTGGGKSLCYQLPALSRDGLTVVISPLIALMRDQVSALREAGVEAGALNSANDPWESERVFEALAAGKLRLLYMAPERLASPASVDLLRRSGVTLLAIDEAHCVSQWGHDFRPDYLRLGALREALGGVQTAAFTATADADTREDICARLFGPAPEVFLRGFDRPNLYLAFEPKASPRGRIVDFVRRRPGQSGIIYCSSRKKTETYAAALAAAGVTALAYHAGLDPETRSERQDRFNREDGVVIAATVAFGMGVDKPDVRFVVHADLPKSMEAYYQEVGRAGRDGAPADTLTLYGIDDIKLRRKQIDEGDAPGERKRADHQRLNALLALAEAPRCRRQTLLAYFGESRAEPCGNCDLCREPPERFDGTEAVRKALSAMLRTGERFGVEHLIAVLRGEASERVRQLGHDALRTFGVGAEFERNQWRAIFRQMYSLCLASVTEMGGWRMTPAGRRVLRGEETVMLRKDALTRRARGRKAKTRPVAGLGPEDGELFEALRTKRSELARARGVPAYVIFPDVTLIDIAQRKPRTLDEFAGCHGVGAKKLESFGKAFLEVVAAGPVALPHPARRKLAGNANGGLFDALAEAQAGLAHGDFGTDRYLACTPSTLAKIAEARPRDLAGLERIPGMGALKTERFGAAFLACIRAAGE
ncbi:MAG: DNA helicase RecQ [Paracoccaceae bacterium]